jgi:AcrR family transcriptional regulator
MAGLGLTRGGFCSYFSSKSELYAVAVGAVLAERPVSQSELAASDAARDLIRGYLSPRQLDGAESLCSLVTLPSSVASRDAPVRREFEPAFRRMVKVFEQCLELEGRPDRDRAVLAATLCIGGMTIGRALDTSQLAGQVRGAALNHTIALMGWSPQDTLGTGPRGGRRLK